MKHLLAIVGLLALAAGCATHYHQVQEETLMIYLDKPDAHQVIFACSLDGFEPREAWQRDGVWVVSLPSDTPFIYYYVLDGHLFLPPCQLKEKDDFGSENCIFDPSF